MFAAAAARDEWLAQVVEEVIDPGREIVDPHHHLWNREGIVYELDHLHSDTGCGHNVVQTVFIECRAAGYEGVADGFGPVAETAYVVGQAQLSALRPDAATLAGIVAHADLRHPKLDQILDAHATVGGPLFKGIRHAGACDPEPEHLAIPGRGDPGLYLDPAFQRGVARLGERGLSYDTWHYHHQNQDFLTLAQAVPETTMVLDHFGAPLGVGRFAGKRAEIFAAWKDDVAAIAECPNVIAKLGGMAMPDIGFGWHKRGKTAEFE